MTGMRSKWTTSRAGRSHFRVLLFVLVASSFLPLAWNTPVAYAHAKLLSSTPAQGSQLDALPINIVLEFTEPVGLEFSIIDAYDGKGDHLPGGSLMRSGGRETTVALPLQSQEQQGVIYVIWRVVSSVDGHL